MLILVACHVQSIYEAEGELWTVKSMPIMTECRLGGSTVWNAVPSSIYSLVVRENLKFSLNAVVLNYRPSEALEIMHHVSPTKSLGARGHHWLSHAPGKPEPAAPSEVPTLPSVC